MQTKDFYGTVTRLCAQKGISITALAKELGLSKSTPTDWKRKGAQPQAKTLKSIGEYFGVSVDCLLGTESFLGSEDAQRSWHKRNTLNENDSEYWLRGAMSRLGFSIIDDDPVCNPHIKTPNAEYEAPRVKLDALFEYLKNCIQVSLENANNLNNISSNGNFANNINNSQVVQGYNSSIGTVTGQSLADSQAKELFEIFNSLNTVEKSKLFVYAAELKGDK